jgi:hypothetical protein
MALGGMANIAVGLGDVDVAAVLEEVVDGTAAAEVVTSSCCGWFGSIKGEDLKLGLRSRF